MPLARRDLRFRELHNAWNCTGLLRDYSKNHWLLDGVKISKIRGKPLGRKSLERARRLSEANRIGEKQPERAAQGGDGVGAAGVLQAKLQVEAKAETPCVPQAGPLALADLAYSSLSPWLLRPQPALSLATEEGELVTKERELTIDERDQTPRCAGSCSTGMPEDAVPGCVPWPAGDMAQACALSHVD
jgi:hypothetical protein